MPQQNEQNPHSKSQTMGSQRKRRSRASRGASGGYQNKFQEQQTVMKAQSDYVERQRIYQELSTVAGEALIMFRDNPQEFHSEYQFLWPQKPNRSTTEIKQKRTGYKMCFYNFMPMAMPTAADSEAWHFKLEPEEMHTGCKVYDAVSSAKYYWCSKTPQKLFFADDHHSHSHYRKSQDIAKVAYEQPI